MASTVSSTASQSSHITKNISDIPSLSTVILEIPGSWISTVHPMRECVIVSNYSHTQARSKMPKKRQGVLLMDNVAQHVKHAPVRNSNGPTQRKNMEHTPLVSNNHTPPQTLI
ncbi:hypothetical protein CRE_08964 [Caenorhabditis remanei]|uniref:Uncharacterized protein n=1 Tax=Caenorhabditis remanei TaxID=31234 RepID=E3LIH9_CAERE|nr:hypothetical protein CRE_08964 [Caenorhabditis remanei]